MARSFVDIGKALLEYRFRPQSPSTLRTFLDRERPLVRDAPEPLWRRLYWNGYLPLFGATHWMMTKEVGTQLARPARVAVAVAGEDARAAAATSCASWCGTPTGTCPTTAIACAQMGIAPDDIRALDDLHKLPFLTKDDVRKHLYFDIMSDNHDKAEILKVTTSGSTGEPFVCFVDRAQLEFRWAATLRSMEWTG